jgi:hypothetical protein
MNAALDTLSMHMNAAMNEGACSSGAVSTGKQMRCHVCDRVMATASRRLAAVESTRLQRLKAIACCCYCCHFMDHDISTHSMLSRQHTQAAAALLGCKHTSKQPSRPELTVAFICRDMN